MLRWSFKHKRYQTWFILTRVIVKNGGSAEKAAEQCSSFDRVNNVKSIEIDEANALQQKTTESDLLLFTLFVTACLETCVALNKIKVKHNFAL